MNSLFFKGPCYGKRQKKRFKGESGNPILGVKQPPPIPKEGANFVVGEDIKKNLIRGAHTHNPKKDRSGEKRGSVH